MPAPAQKIALLHEDAEIAERVSRVARGAGVDVVRVQSFAALAALARNPLLGAIVLDVPAPREGGFEILERLDTASLKANVIIIAAMDVKTAESTRKRAHAKGFELAVLRKQGLDDKTLLAQLTKSRDVVSRFGPAELDDCLEKHLFRVEYQPKVPLFDPSGSSPFGVEALCRINAPQFGAVSPDHFIPMAERCGLIPKLTHAVIGDAFRDWNMWRKAGLLLKLAVNVSPALLRDNEWSDRFLTTSEEHGVDPQWITLEITESAAGATDPEACEILNRLKGKGFSLSIDDFGTGFSSLATLYRLPIGELKIDKSFILDLQGAAGARSLVESTISMAQRMGLKVVAEGVESESLFRELRRIGCHEAQGFFIGKSMAADEVVSFFTGWKKSMQDSPAQTAPGKGLPKIAIVQALLKDIATAKPTKAKPAQQWNGKALSTPAVKDDGHDLLAKIPPLVLEGKTIAALALCEAAVAQLQDWRSNDEIRTKLAQLTGLMQQDLVNRKELELHGAHGVFRLLRRNALTFGRPSVNPVDIPIKCRWLSPGDKNLRLFVKGDQWFLEDRGSAHGHYVDGERLQPRQPYALTYGKIVVDIGLASGGAAPVSVILRQTSTSPGALTISFDYDAETLQSDIGKDWPALEAELSATWIAFDKTVTVGKSLQNALVLEECGWANAATITFDNGFWIAPAAEGTLGIDGASFTQKAPLPAECQLQLINSQLRVRPFAPPPATPSVLRTGTAF